MLYHYCSNDTFLKILSNRELWLSELTLTNDAMEGVWVREVLLQECARRNVPKEASQDFAERTDFLLSLISAAGFCLSEKGDLLSQWRAYAQNGAGVAIGFEKNLMQGLTENRISDAFGVSLQQIEYDTQAQHALMAPHVDRFCEYFEKGVTKKFIGGGLLSRSISKEEKNEMQKLRNDYGFSFLLLFGLLFRLKNPAFSEELEWRLMAIMLKGGDVSSESISRNTYNDPQSIDFRSCGERIVPYLRLPVNEGWNGCIKEVVLGPRNQTPDAVMRAFLTKVGLSEVVIKRSAATYR